jgi:hypothetical protein
MFKRSIYTVCLMVLGLLFSMIAHSQEFTAIDSANVFPVSNLKIKNKIHYSLGSSFMFVPRYGSISGMNASAFYSIPVSSRLTVEAGLLAGRYYSAFKGINPENKVYNTFNTLSVYGTAAYQLNQRLTVYGTGIKQLAGQMPLYNMPSNSFTFGSTLNFGNFSVGASIQMSDWNNYFSPSRYSGNPDYFSGFPW